LEHEVGTPPLVERRRVDLDADEQVAVGSAVSPLLALALQPDAGAVLRARRHLDLIPARDALATGSAARRTGRVDDDAVAAAAMAGMGEREKALAVRDDAAPLAVGARAGRGAGLGAAAA